MVRQLTGEDYTHFVREKGAAAIHFDAHWNVGNRPVMRRQMQEAEEALSEQCNFGEIDCDRDMPLAKAVRLPGIPAVAYYLEGNLVAFLAFGYSTERMCAYRTRPARRANWL